MIIRTSSWQLRMGIVAPPWTMGVYVLEMKWIWNRWRKSFISFLCSSGRKSSLAEYGGSFGSYLHAFGKNADALLRVDA